MPSNRNIPGRKAPIPVPPSGTAHRPHVEYFDIADLTRTDSRGFVHSVDSYHAEPWGLYLVRAADTPPYRYTETWLLPRQSIRVTMHHVNAAHDRDPIYHIYIGNFARIEPKRWRAEYHYIDIVARNGHVCELHGVDELFAAHAAGHVSAETAQHAFEQATAVVDGIASHDHNFERWLTTQGITLHWL
ncbi:hypothetical protein C5E45_09035 [Nocardia nova]|uniref:DUF402 domain-containing protein n=1 Tax=Nocardia nova TaxID=37330 RepID=A0A2S6ATT8_9NOCA|nr:hypothetical protein [Nocardia nova]PPJ26147.1 hypothetical protein C5E41_18270 [Nocardia nova]PPJ38603.1 hypothetical protein C5E45_09035 [Nocardia nova]